MKIASALSADAASPAPAVRQVESSFSAMMGSERPRGGLDRAAGFDALGMFGRFSATSMPSSNFAPDRLNASLTRAESQVRDSRVVHAADPSASKVRNGIESAAARPGPKIASPQCAKPARVVPSAVADLTPEVVSGRRDASSLKAKEGPLRPIVPRRLDGLAESGSFDVRLGDAIDGVSLNVAGALAPSVLERFRETARALLAREGYYLHRFIVNGEDRLSGPTQKGPASWR